MLIKPALRCIILTSSLKSWDMRLVTRERCCRKIPSAVKQYPYVSGEFKPVERYTKRK